MVVFPNAKINLGLNVLRRRADGYHDINSVMVGVDWCDILEIVPSSIGIDSLHCTGHFIDCPMEKNLVYKAVGVLRRQFPNSIPALEIHLHKNVPDGAGLGGGSADAAFAMSLVNSLFSLGLDKEQLAEYASQVGCDCPFFVYNEPMSVEGRGEIMTPVPEVMAKLEKYRVVIVKQPDVSVSTAEAYAGLTPKMPEIDCLSVIGGNDVAHWPGLLTNDFEASIFAKTDVPGSIKKRLYSAGAVYAAMSGSGSAVYGLFTTETAAKTDFGLLFPGCQVHVGRFIGTRNPIS